MRPIVAISVAAVVTSMPGIVISRRPFQGLGWNAR
jgi:hypothetical protein